MAQDPDDFNSSGAEDQLQYFCHECDMIRVVEEIDYTDDGTIKCKVCNEQYVEILDPEEDDDDSLPRSAPNSSSGSNAGNSSNAQNTNNSQNNNSNNNNNQNQSNRQQWQTYQDANGQQIFYWTNAANQNGGQPPPFNFNGFNNLMQRAFMGFPPNNANQNNGNNNNNNNNNNNPHQRIQQAINTGMNMGMQMMFDPNNQANFGQMFGGNMGDMMAQMVNMQNGPPPTSTNTINSLPEYEYNGPVASDDSDDDEDEQDEHPMQETHDHEQHGNNADLPVTDEGVANETTDKAEVHVHAAEEQEEEEKETDKKNRDCAICKCGFQKGDLLKELPCTHRYHKDCIMPWITRRNTCPTCRHRLPTDNAMYEQMENARQRAEQNRSNNNPPNPNRGAMPFPFFQSFNQLFQPPMMPNNGNVNNNNNNNNNSNNSNSNQQ